MIFKDVNNMETKINIAEILKCKPKGTKLYSPLFGDVYLSSVKDSIINVEHHGGMTKFFGDGRYYNYPESEPLLFPSKEMRDWSKFAWKRGDVLINDAGYKVLLDKWENDDYTRFSGSVKVHCYDTEDYTLAPKEEALEFIKSIEKTYGGKLNLDTLKIEKPEFKDGDIVFVESPMLGIDTNFMIAIFRKEKEIGKYKFSPALYESNEHDTYLKEDPVVLSPSHIKTFRLATDSEKQRLFEALAKEGKVWDAKEKQVVDLKPKVDELKPFDKVLVRDTKSDYWRATLFSHIDKNGLYYCVWDSWIYCIPYNEKTKHLLNTNDKWEESKG